MRKLKWEQIGIMNMNYLFYTLDYFLDAAVDMGVQNINLWVANPHAHLDEASDADYRRIAAKLRERDLKCSAFARNRSSIRLTSRRRIRAFAGVQSRR